MQKIRSIVWAVMFQGQKDLTYMQIYASVKTHAGRRLMANHIRGETLWVYTVFGTTYWITRAKIVPTCHGCEARVEKTHGSSAIWGVPTYDRPLFSALTLRGWYMLLDVRGRESCCRLGGGGGQGQIYNVDISSTSLCRHLYRQYCSYRLVFRETVKLQVWHNAS
jgi:hypothetical protein